MAYTGTVVSWFSRKGFGFVQCRDFEQDLYVHVSGFGSGELIEGKTVSFDVQDDTRDGKKRCVNVTGEAVDPNRRDDRDDRRGGGRDRYDSRDRRGGGRYDSRDRRGGGRDRYDSRDRYESRDRRGGGRDRYDSRDRDYGRR